MPETPYYAPSPPEKSGKGRNKLLWGCLGGCLGLIFLCLVVVGIICTVFWTEITTAWEGGKTAFVLAEVVGEDAPRLQRDFPFDRTNPPEIDSGLLERFRKTRDAVAREADPIVPRITDLLVRFGEIGQAGGDPDEVAERMKEYVGDEGLEGLNELWPALRDALKAIEPALRESNLSFEHYQYVAAQIWGNLATAVVEENPEARAHFQGELDEWWEVLGIEEEKPDLGEAAQGLLDQIDKIVSVKDMPNLRADLTGELEYWADSERAGLFLDFFMIHWGEVQNAWKDGGPKFEIPSR